MDSLYDNGMYKIVVNRYDNVYLIVNIETEVVEARESALPTAKFKAEALKGAAAKFEQLENK